MLFPILVHFANNLITMLQGFAPSEVNELISIFILIMIAPAGYIVCRSPRQDKRADMYVMGFYTMYKAYGNCPHFSTVVYNFRHRFTAETVDQVFAWILEEVAEAGYLSPKAFYRRHPIKANANTKKQIKEQVPVASKHYARN